MENICSLFFQFRDFHSITVHIYVFTGNLPAFVDPRDFAVARVFYCVGFIFTEKLDQKSVEIFRSGTDDDLLRQDSHTAEFFQIGGDGFPEWQDPTAGRIGHQLHLVGIQNFPDNLCPDGKGK